jgi:hypothetical protein
MSDDARTGQPAAATPDDEPLSWEELAGPPPPLFILSLYHGYSTRNDGSQEPELRQHAAQDAEKAAQWLAEIIKPRKLPYQGPTYHGPAFSNIIIRSYRELAELSDTTLPDGYGEDSIFVRVAYDAPDGEQQAADALQAALRSRVADLLGEDSERHKEGLREAQRRRERAAEAARQEAARLQWERERPEREARQAREKAEKEAKEKAELARLLKLYPQGETKP